MKDENSLRFMYIVAIRQTTWDNHLGVGVSFFYRLHSILSTLLENTISMTNK